MSKGDEDWKVIAALGGIEHLPAQVWSQLWRARGHVNSSPGSRGKVEIRCISRVQDGQPWLSKKVARSRPLTSVTVSP